jgi:phosphinothricin acetyltransferase
VRPLVRDATLADLPEIVAIYNSTVASRLVTADLEPVTVASRRAWFDAHGPAYRPLWVAPHHPASSGAAGLAEPAGSSQQEANGDSENGIAGWLSFSDYYGRPAYRHTAEISIYLAAAARGQGLGKRLLQEALDRAPALQVHNAVAVIFGHNEPSLQLFRSFGFADWGLLPRVTELDGIERDVVILGRRTA